MATAKRDRDSSVCEIKDNAAAQILLSIRDRDPKIAEALLDKKRVLVEPFVNWYNGKVMDVLNEKGRRVLIEWNTDCLGTKDARISKHRLAITKWNPETCTEGAWRHYIRE